MKNKGPRQEIQTKRQKMMVLLCRETLTALEISQMLSIKEKEVYDHLSHISKTVLIKGGRLILLPSICQKCGYIFKGRKRFSKPGRCPSCKGTNLLPPAYYIE